jgi:hypothetical protein
MQQTLTNTPVNYFWQRTAYLYIFLLFISFSFPHYFLPDVGAFTQPFFANIAYWVAVNLLGKQTSIYKALISDSTVFYVHAVLMWVPAFTAGMIWQKWDKQNTQWIQYKPWFRTCFRYYLFLQLMVYAFQKIFLWQFYTPEPNTLYTAVGQVNKDLLFWTVMGASPTYSIITGCIELMIAFLLISRRTLLPGLLLCYGVLLQILLINVGFDISVKLYTVFLLLIATILLAPFIPSMCQFFSGKNQAIPIENPITVLWRKKT